MTRREVLLGLLAALVYGPLAKGDATRRFRSMDPESLAALRRIGDAKIAESGPAVIQWARRHSIGPAVHPSVESVDRAGLDGPDPRGASNPCIAEPGGGKTAAVVGGWQVPADLLALAVLVAAST